MQIGFSEHDGAGIKQRLNDSRILLRAMLLECWRPARGGSVSRIDVVLDGNRQAVEPAPALAAAMPFIGSLGLVEHRRCIKRYEGVDFLVKLTSCKQCFRVVAPPKIAATQTRHRFVRR